LTIKIAIAAHTPSQDDGVSLESNVDSRGNKTTGATGPSLASSQGIATAIADRTIVATLAKAAAGSQDVLKWSAVYADLQYAAVSAVFQ
jgi:hypothetical protein